MVAPVPADDPVAAVTHVFVVVDSVAVVPVWVLVVVVDGQVNVRVRLTVVDTIGALPVVSTVCCVPVANDPNVSSPLNDVAG